MQVPRRPKVCFPVAGKPAIAHTLECLESLGFSPNILVVGHLAGTVVDEIGPGFSRVLFAYQSELLGTGHATKQGAALLSEMDFDGAVLVLAGDKVIEPRAIEKLIQSYRVDSPDLALLVAPKERWPSAGRVVTGKEGQVLRIIEKADLQNAETGDSTFEIEGRRLTVQDVEARVKWVNQAVYLFRAKALYEALGGLARDNVQKEEYLTDTIDFLVKAGKSVLPVPVDDPEDVLGFNDPSELLEIEEHFRRKSGIPADKDASLDPRVFKPPEKWIRLLADRSPEVDRMLRSIYGDNPSLCEEKRNRLRQTVELFVDRFGREGLVTVVRAPGRVNLMGRHVDHRGGCVNLMAIDREHILVARRREDTTVRARNADTSQFEEQEFSLDDLLRRVRLDDWHDFLNSDQVLKMVRDLRGDWGNYLKAPMLRLQQETKDRQIKGLDCVVSGDIPVAAGLSSSSALVVAMAEALVRTNRLDLSPDDLVDVCGEGEWFVGTRGGSADHAAIKMSQFGQIAHVGFFPFAIHDYVPFPDGFSLIICDSRVQARKAAGAREAFNERVASFELAVHLVRKRFPNYAPLIQRLRDICPENLGIRFADIYRILLDIPVSVSSRDLQRELGEEVFGQVASMHTPPEKYRLRERLLFGIAECERSKYCHRLLRNNEIAKFGWLMNVSHDGDRVRTAEGEPFICDVDSETIRSCIEGLQSEDPDRVLAAQLYAQPGAYACSIPEIDLLVDIALGTPGVLGAQISGAGLGGCMMVLSREEATEEVVSRMESLYYQPKNLEPGAMIFTPIAGCSPVATDG